MTIGEMETPAGCDCNGSGKLGLQTPALQFQFPNPDVQLRVGCPDEVRNAVDEHGFMVANICM